jgi:hypothetical protein
MTRMCPPLPYPPARPTLAFGAQERAQTTAAHAAALELAAGGAAQENLAGLLEARGK